MAKVEKHGMPKRRRQTKSQYAQYFDGQMWVLTMADAPHGVRDLHGLHVSVNKTAFRLGVRVNAKCVGQELYVQAVESLASAQARQDREHGIRENVVPGVSRYRRRKEQEATA